MTDELQWRPIKAWVDKTGQQWALIEWADGRREERRVKVDVEVKVNEQPVSVDNVKVGDKCE